VIVSLSVPRTASPEAVRDVMLMCAQLHPDVQREPPPRVLFKKIGESTLEFDLICVVPEVDIAGRVQSDLHFAIYENFERDGIGQPEREVSVKGLDRIEDTLEELVDTIEEAQDAQAQVAAQRRQKAEAARSARRAGKGDAGSPPQDDKP
jgi:small-conductance mechanosensitive channel